MEKGIDHIKGRLRMEMELKYGGVSKFLRSEDGAKFGGMKIKPYLYSSGAVSFRTLAKLYEFFGIGILTRKVVIKKTYHYYVDKRK